MMTIEREREIDRESLPGARAPVFGVLAATLMDAGLCSMASRRRGPCRSRVRQRRPGVV